MSEQPTVFSGISGASSPVPIGAGRTEAQIAADYREQVIKAVGGVLDILNAARQQHNMTINFQLGGPDGFNRMSLVVLEITKKLC